MRHYPNGDAAIYDVTQRILRDGEVVAPRDLRTKELLHESFVVEYPWDCLPVGISRPKLSLAMGALESLQNVAGIQCPGLFRQIAPASSKFAMLVYGERLALQMPMVEAELRRDPWSRQAIATVWHDGILGDTEAGSNHCALSLQFLLRKDRLDLAVHMRSNDAWWGLTYDLVQFAQVQATLAGILDADIGRLVWHAGSMHLYERHWEVAQQLVEPGDGPIGEEAVVRNLTGVAGSSWLEAARRADAMLHGVRPHDATLTEKFLHAQLLPHVVAAREQVTV